MDFRMKPITREGHRHWAGFIITHDGTLMNFNPANTSCIQRCSVVAPAPEQDQPFGMTRVFGEAMNAAPEAPLPRACPRCSIRRVAAALRHLSHRILCCFVKAVLLLAYNSGDFEERFFSISS